MSKIPRKYKFTNCVAERRKLLALSQNELAALVGCSTNSISSIETGQFEPTAYTAGLLCRALLCSFEELFFYEPL